MEFVSGAVVQFGDGGCFQECVGVPLQVECDGAGGADDGAGAVGGGSDLACDESGIEAAGGGAVEAEGGLQGVSLEATLLR